MNKIKSHEEALDEFKAGQEIRFKRSLQYITAVSFGVLIINNPMFASLIMETWRAANSYWMETTLATGAVLCLVSVYYISFKINK